MKKVFQSDKAVSPIIATILLIAITVVLAATLISILSTLTNSTHAQTIDSSVSLSNAIKNQSGTSNEYYLNVSSTSVSPSLSSMQIEIFDGSVRVYEGPLSNRTSANITITDVISSTFSAGNVIEITLSGKNIKITSVDLIYANTVFSTVTPF
jgi:flagellin-like protein